MPTTGLSPEKTKERKVTEIQKTHHSPAHEWEACFLSLVESMQMQWFTLGRMVHECKVNRYFDALGFPSYEAWAKAHADKLQHQRASAYKARAVYVGLLQANVQESDMAKLKLSNASTLKFAPRNNGIKRELIIEAQTLSADQLQDTYIRRGWITEDPKKNWVISTVRSRAEELDALMEQVMDKLTDDNKPNALVTALTHFVDCDYVRAEEY